MPLNGSFGRGLESSLATRNTARSGRIGQPWKPRVAVAQTNLHIFRLDAAKLKLEISEEVFRVESALAAGLGRLRSLKLNVSQYKNARTGVDGARN